MVVSFNFYYAQPGQQDAVLRQRLRACEVRQDLGIPRGRVLSRITGAAALPDVVWEHRFEDVGGHHADMAVRAASPEFEAVRAGMRKLCRRFERPLFEDCTTAAGSDTAPASGIVTLDWIFCSPEKTEEILAFLDQHARRHVQQGYNGGQLLRLITPGNDLPALVWRRDFLDSTSHERVQAEMARRSEQQWPAQINALAQFVEHSLWRVV